MSGEVRGEPGASRRTLLAVDAAVNFILGLVLTLAPGSTAAVFGLPQPGSGFYARILGAVLVGIGVALVIECRRGEGRVSGLGLAGAVAINLCGALGVAAWLIAAGDMPFRGRLLLWILVAVLFALSAFEAARMRRR